MDVLIKNMDMPNRCEECALFDEDYGECRRETDPLKRTITRENGCPLVEIPPHGRLIDADTLAEDYNIRLAIDFPYMSGSVMDEMVKTVSIASQIAPTVLEASECLEK